MSDYILHMDDGTVLCHYGRKGMKWGRNIFSKNKDAKSKKQKLKLSDLSDEDIQKRIDRLQLEKKYKDLVKSDRDVKVGKDIYNDVLKKSVSVASVGLASIGVDMIRRKLLGNK